MLSQQGGRKKCCKGNDGSDFGAEASRVGKSTVQAALYLENLAKGTDSDSSHAAEQTAAE